MPRKWFLPSIVAPTRADEIWTEMLDRHDDLFQLFGPPIFSRPGTTSPDGLQLHGEIDDEIVYRWRVRGNADLCYIIARVEAKAVTDTGNLNLTVGGGSPSGVTVNQAGWRHYHIVVPFVAEGPQNCVLTADVLTGDEIRVRSVECWLLTPPVNSDWAQGAASLHIPAPSRALGRPITSEYVERIFAGPIGLALDRPICVFSHAAPVLFLGQQYGSWGYANGADGAARTEVVGRGIVAHRLDDNDKVRNYAVDLYWDQFGNGTGDIKLGEAPAFRVAADGWYTFNVLCRPGDEIWATVSTNATSILHGGRFDTIQVWESPPVTEESP